MSDKNPQYLHSLHVKLEKRFSVQELSEALDSLKHFSNEIIVTSLPSCVFTFDTCKNDFEALFKTNDPACQIVYLPSFHRAKVYLSSFEAALAAKCRVDQHAFPIHPVSQAENDQNLTSTTGSSNRPHHGGRSPTTASSSVMVLPCYFSHKTTNNSTDALNRPHHDFLVPPQPEKQYLISPPGSPPDDWEPKKEAEPAINYDLLAALSKLAPGEVHEIQAPHGNVPGIVLTPSNEDAAMLGSTQKPGHRDDGPLTHQRVKFVPTKRPEERHS